MPSLPQASLRGLFSLARWLATEATSWSTPARLHELAQRLAAAVDAELSFVARIHPGFLPPPVISILGSSINRDAQLDAEAVGDALVPLFAESADALAAGQACEFPPRGAGGPRYFAYAQPILVAGDLWGVIGFTDRRGCPIRDSNTADALQLIATQLGERLRATNASAELQRSSHDELFRAAIEGLEDGIVIYDADYHVAAYNQAWRHFTRNVSPGVDLRGISLVDLYREYVRVGAWTAEQADIVTREILAGRSAGIRDRMVKQDGRFVRIRNYPISSGGIVSVRSDVTDLVAREQQLLKAKETAEVASRAKSTFLASVSHELRTPLNAIIGFSDVMRQEVFGPLAVARYREYVGDIHRSGTLLLSLINDIMDMARIESGKVELSLEAFDIDTLVREVLPLLQLRAEAKNIALGSTIARDLLSVMADRRATTQILLNVVVNAIKFTPAGGKVEIGVERAGDSIEVAVSDNGPGIRKEDLARLGRPFERLDMDAIEVAAENKGTGLGLAISSALAEQQKGSLRVDSEVGRGTTVFLRLPLVR